MKIFGVSVDLEIGSGDRTGLWAGALDKRFVETIGGYVVGFRASSNLLIFSCSAGCSFASFSRLFS